MIKPGFTCTPLDAALDKRTRGLVQRINQIERLLVGRVHHVLDGADQIGNLQELHVELAVARTAEKEVGELGARSETKLGFVFAVEDKLHAGLGARQQELVQVAVVEWDAPLHDDAARRVRLVADDHARALQVDQEAGA